VAGALQGAVPRRAQFSVTLFVITPSTLMLVRVLGAFSTCCWSVSMLPSLVPPKRAMDEIPFRSPGSTRSGSAPLVSVSRSHAEQLLLEDDGTSEENVLPDAVSKTKTTATTTGKAKLKKVVKRRRNSLHQVTATMAARAAEAKQRIEALKNESALKEQQLNQRSSSMASASKAAQRTIGFFSPPSATGIIPYHRGGHAGGHISGISSWDGTAWVQAAGKPRTALTFAAPTLSTHTGVHSQALVGAATAAEKAKKAFKDPSQYCYDMYGKKHDIGKLREKRFKAVMEGMTFMRKFLQKDNYAALFAI
jgi:uncharacterized protein YdaT